MWTLQYVQCGAPNSAIGCGTFSSQQLRLFFAGRAPLRGQRLPLLREPLQAVQLLLRQPLQGAEGPQSKWVDNRQHRGLSYKKRRFKRPKVWDVWNVNSEFGTFNIVAKRPKFIQWPKLWDVWNILSYRRDLWTFLWRGRFAPALTMSHHQI